ncbi:transposase family protein [Kitasatospora sp. NPDC054939]
MTQSCSLLRELLFPSVSEVAVVRVEPAGPVVRLEARSTAGGANCPGCGAWSNRVHGSYLRFPADLPSAGRRVVLVLRVRRFACPDESCRGGRSSSRLRA